MPCWSLGQSTGTRTGCFLIPRFQATKVGRLHPPFPVQALMGSWGALRNHYLHSLGSHFQNMVSTLALFITVIYWTLFHRSVIEAGFLKVLPFSPSDKTCLQTFQTPLDEFLNFFAHALNTVTNQNIATSQHSFSLVLTILTLIKR